MSVSQADLAHIVYSSGVENLIHKLKKEDLLLVVQDWFKIPELRPPRSGGTWEDYAALQQTGKVKVVDRITNVDWPDGLCALQCAQLNMKYLIPNASIKVWKTWKLQSVNYPEALELSIDLKTARDRMQAYLEPFYKCHVYAVEHTAEIRTHWFRISLFENSRSDRLPPTTNNAYFVHFPNTEFLLNGGGLKSDIKDYIVKAILHAFSAETMRVENLTSKRIATLTEMVLHGGSLGVFSQFRENHVDTNPLDIRQKKARRQEDYVNTREEKRRIVPVDKERMENRYKQVSDTFGFYPVQGVESLEINLSLPMTGVVDTSVLAGSEEDVEMNLLLKGTNVMKGLRDLMLRGVVEPPLPLWMTELVSAGTNKVFVTRNGILQEQVDDDEEDNNDDDDADNNQDIAIQAV